jgi:DNA-binding Lrp family transcriptional regulator
MEMATKAYILIETAVGKSREVVGALKASPGMQAVDAVTGPYDIIAVLEARDLNAVGSVVTGRVHTIGGILRTVTCLSVTAAQ